MPAHVSTNCICSLSKRKKRVDGSGRMVTPAQDAAIPAHIEGCGLHTCPQKGHVWHKACRHHYSKKKKTVGKLNLMSLPTVCETRRRAFFIFISLQIDIKV